MSEQIVVSFGVADLVVRTWIGGVPIIGVRQNIDRWVQFKGMSGRDQFEFLRKEVAAAMGNKVSNTDKGYVAKKIRGLVKSMKLDYLFELENKSTRGSRHFMNVDLRDFLNLKEDGTDEYIWDDLHNKSGTLKKGWEETSSIGASYHQYRVDNKDGHQYHINKMDGHHYNAKFLHSDGREVIFDYNKMMVNDPIDKGTFNYVPVEIPPEYKIILYASSPITIAPDAVKFGISYHQHGLYDVTPWKDWVREKFPEEFPKDFDFAKNRKYNKKYGGAKKNSELWLPPKTMEPVRAKMEPIRVKVADRDVEKP